MAETKDPFLRCNKPFQRLADAFFNPKEYFVFSPWCQRIGHVAVELMLAVSIAIRDNKELILIPHTKSVNKEIFKSQFNCRTYQRKDWKITILKTAILLADGFHYLYNGIRSKIIKFLPFISKIVVPVFYYPRYGIEKGKWNIIKLRGTENYHDWKLLLSTDFQVSLTSDQRKRGEAIRMQMGIPEDAWFVCLHVREKGYVGPNPDDSSISNYLPAIRHITRKGGYVVRMGDPSMTPLQPMNKVVDYANSKFRSDLMDIYLISSSRFYIGCSSGLYFIAWAFRKPTCILNWTLMPMGFPCFPNDMFIYKGFFSKKEQRFLSLKEALSCAMMRVPDHIMYVENSPLEILEAIKEYMHFLEKGKFYDSDHLQNEYRVFRAKRQEYILKQDSVSGDIKSLIAGTMPAQGRLGSFYLENNWENKDYLREMTKLYNGDA